MNKSVLKALHSSKSNEWTTPDWLFKKLDKEFNFSLDPCATKENTKCKKFYTLEDDGLQKDWTKDVVFMNPPYGIYIAKWIQKAYDESRKGSIVCCLIPARCDTRYWHDFIFPFASQIRFFRGRVGYGNTKTSPFPSCLVIFGKNYQEKIIWNLSKVEN